MKLIQTTLLIAFSVLSLSASDFDDAVASYNKGNYVQALNSFYVLAKSGDADAQYNVGLIYANGKGIKADPGQAMEWYEKAANSGQGMAAYNLGQMYYNREENNSQKYEHALQWYELAGKKGVAEANNNIAAMYQDGIGVKKNKKKAFIYFKKAAEGGSVAGQLNVALIYGWGPKIIRDEKKAYRYMSKALKAGKREAKPYIEKLCKTSPDACKK